MGAICFGAKRGHNFSSVPLFFWHHFMHTKGRMNIEQHQALARDVSPSTPRINGLYSVCSVCQAADVKWVGKRGNQIGFVVRLICIFDIAPDDRTEIGEKSASAAARRRVIEIESSLTQIRRRARFGAEIGFLTALEESASLSLSLRLASGR